VLSLRFDLVISPLVAIYSILAANPIMFFLDFTHVYLIKIRPKSDSPT